MSRAIEKIRASIGFKKQALEKLAAQIARDELAAEQMESLASQMRASGSSDVEIEAAIMAAQPARFRNQRVNRKYGLPVDEARELSRERAIMQALLDGPKTRAQLLTLPELQHLHRRKITSLLDCLRSTGVVSVRIGLDNTPMWEISK